MGGVWYERVMCGIPANCLLGSDGRLHIYGYDRDEGPAPVHHVGKADGAPFSTDAQVVGSWGRVALVAEPKEGTLWRFDLQRGGPGFQPAALPGGDTFVEDLTEALEAAPSFLKMYAPHPTVIRGQKGLYEPEKGDLRAASAEVVSAVQSLDRRRQWPEAQIAMEGPVRFRATLPAAGSEPAFSHDYAPYTAAEKGLSVQMHGLSLLRPPLLELASLLFPSSPPNLGNPTDDDTRILLDPLVMLGARWVLIIDLLLGAALAALAFRRSTRLGLPAPRRLFWTLVAFGFGPAGFVVYRACEGDRAWQPLPEAAPKRALLIESAA
jgi:hypothetical protein